VAGLLAAGWTGRGQVRSGEARGLPVDAQHGTAPWQTRGAGVTAVRQPGRSCRVPPRFDSVGRERRVGREECCHVPRKGLVKLEEGAVAGVGYARSTVFGRSSLNR